MKNIVVKPEDCWEYFLDNHDDLLVNDHIIADNIDDYGIEICLGIKSDLPKFDVFLDDDIIYSIDIPDGENMQAECEEVLKEIYEDYLDDIENTLKRLVSEENDKDDTDDDDETDDILDKPDEYWDKLINDDSIAVQEQQIDDSLQEFLETICNGFIKKLFTPNEFEDIKDHFCEYIARKYKKKVYRPMYLEE